MIVGLGDLGAQVLDMLVRSAIPCRIILAGRNEEALIRRKNLALFTAMHLGNYPEVEIVFLDVNQIEQTAETLKKVNPDFIYSTITLQSWRVITELPKKVFEELDEAQFGPWLPMHLTPVYKLMQAVKMSGSQAPVINSAFPDCVNHILSKVNLAPTLGIGNVSNVIPALRCSAAHLLGADVQSVKIKLFTQHYFSHRVPRYGDSGGAPYSFSVYRDGKDVTEELQAEDVFKLLTKQFRRLGGITGQMLTAGSAMTVIKGMLLDSQELVHAPGIFGLPGGYAVKIGAKGGSIDLPASLTLEEAIEINRVCQQYDGIERVEDDGTVFFTEREMGIIREMTGYECKSMKLQDCEGQAEEMRAKYVEFSKKMRILAQ
jgi:hypothetical protein